MNDWAQAVQAADDLHEMMASISTEVEQMRAGGPNAADAKADIMKVGSKLEHLADQVHNAVAVVAGEASGVEPS